jgi:hypothetical protein
VRGGNIRNIKSVLEKTSSVQDERQSIDTIVAQEGVWEKLELAYQSTALSSSENSIDRLRAMFAQPLGSGYTTVQYIGTPYLLRLIRSKITLKKTMEGLHFAENSGIQALYGWHFELFGHKVFMESSGHRRRRRCHSFKYKEGEGTGNQSVKQLDASNVYWMPSTSNFANIDAAIALNKILYCIQYTVSSSHSFNCHTFADFLEALPPEFRRALRKVIVVFVVPSDMTFRNVVIPKSQKSFCAKVTYGDGIKLVFRKAGSAGKAVEDEVQGHDENKMEVQGEDENKMEEDVEREADEPGENEDMEESFCDDDCGEEEWFDGEAETGHAQNDPLELHFQWETLGEDVNVERAPLSFLNLPRWAPRRWIPKQILGARRNLTHR